MPSGASPSSSSSSGAHALSSILLLIDVPALGVVLVLVAAARILCPMRAMNAMMARVMSIMVRVVSQMTAMTSPMHMPAVSMMLRTSVLVMERRMDPLQAFLVTGPIVVPEIVVVLVAGVRTLMAAMFAADAGVALGASTASKRGRSAVRKGCSAGCTRLVAVLVDRMPPHVIAAGSRAKRAVRGATPREG